ncbi:hypothetical protein WOLCODRAFT_70241, partial [Wolfiporia cocos MD-104 SS10]
HLDVEDIYKAPIFRKSLDLRSSDFGQSTLQMFTKLRLTEASHASRCSTCAIITRPPEIIACVKLATSYSDIFIIFDSHPRPEHPDGAAFIFLNSIDVAAAYLANLLKYDDRLLMDSSVQWQAQLLAHFSAHIFCARNALGTAAELTEATLEASLDVLNLRARVAELETQSKSLTQENERLNEDAARLEDEVAELKDRQRKDQVRIRALQQEHNRSSTSGSTGKSATVYTSSTSRDVKGKGTYATIARSHFAASSSAGSSRSAGVNDLSFAAVLQMQADELNNVDNSYAASLQRRFDDEDQQLKKQLHTLRQADPGIFECNVCFEKYNEDVVAKVDICGHRFCRDCLREYAATKITEHRYPITCPTCMSEKGRKDIGGMQYGKFIEMQMAAFSIMLHCRKCGDSMFVDRGEYEASEIIACSRQIEIGGPKHSCDGSSELKHLMNERGWKYCPGCQTPAEKISGCNHMTCMSPGCNTHFCYVCGEGITNSTKQQAISSAVSAHYRKCHLFEDVAS